MALELWEIIVVVFILIIFLRPSTITEAARSTGRAVAEWRRTIRGDHEEPSDDLKQLAQKLGISVEGKSAQQLESEIASKAQRDN